MPHLDEELYKLYISLLKSEARHFEDYLELAQEHSSEPVNDRIAFFRNLEGRRQLQSLMLNLV